jgi:hypothetical protein
MTRSFKNSSFTSVTTTDTAKPEKVAIHRKERRTVRQLLHVDPFAEALPQGKEFGDARLFAKDLICYVPTMPWPVDRLRK